MNNTSNQSRKPPLNGTTEAGKKEFLRDELFYLTLTAVVQRGHVYKPGCTEKDAFPRCLRKHLEVIAEDYQVPVVEEAHLRNIELLADQVSSSCSELLCGGRFRIGSAQKALNLFLKYLWCLGEIPQPPPHCPFDRRIIECLPEGAQCNWTECDDIEHYKRWVAEARKIAETQSLSLAGWELLTYNEGTA